MTADKLNVPAIHAWASRKAGAKAKLALPGAAVKAPQAAPLPPQAPPVVEKAPPPADDAVPLAVFVFPSDRGDGRCEIRFNGWPGDEPIQRCKDAGLRYDRTGMAWYGDAGQVLEAAGNIEESNPNAVATYDERAQGLAAWAGCPRRTTGRKARGARKESGPRRSPEERDAALAAAIAAGVAQALAALGMVKAPPAPPGGGR